MSIDDQKLKVTPLAAVVRPQERVTKKFSGRNQNRVGLLIEDTDSEKTKLRGTEYTVNLGELPGILLRRIALGIGKAAAPYYTHGISTPPLIYETTDHQIAAYTQWDILRDDLGETGAQYLIRHYEKMDIRRIITLPKEPNYMQASVAQKWAIRLGFQIPLPTVRRYMEGTEIHLMGVRHVQTEDFFLYLHKWAKRPTPYN